MSVPMNQYSPSRFDSTLYEIDSWLKVPHQVLIRHVQHIDNHILEFLK